MSALQQLLIGIGGDILRLDDATVSSFVVGGLATSRWKLDADGGVYKSQSQVSGGAFVYQYNWVTPASSAPNYECTWSVGTNTVDTTPVAAGTYVALSGDRTWEEAENGGYDNCTFTARIRRIGASTDIKTALISMDADGSP